jgi:carboxylesterase type B
MVTLTSLPGILLPCLALAWSAFASNAAPPTVQLADGKVIGFTLNNTNAFRGIPYAAPPVKSLRFSPPVKNKKWTSPLHATTFAPSCLQMGSPDFKAQGAAWNTLNLTSSDEDCLYLNVYVPATATTSKPLPVMVYLHAGEFRFGSSNDLENACPILPKATSF